MSLMEKMKEQHKKSTAQMKESRQQMKTAVQDGKQAVQQERERQAQANACPNCGSLDTYKEKRSSAGMFILMLVLTVVLTIFLGIVGFIIGCVAMAIPGIRSLQDAIKPKRKCNDCNHIYTK